MRVCVCAVCVCVCVICVHARVCGVYMSVMYITELYICACVRKRA